jgi:hypothetical protein
MAKLEMAGGLDCCVIVAAHRARRMTDEQRSALAAYFALYKGQEEGMAKMFLSATDHPFVASAYALLDAAWHEARPCGPAPGA